MPSDILPRAYVACAGEIPNIWREPGQVTQHLTVVKIEKYESPCDIIFDDSDGSESVPHRRRPE